MFTLRNSDKWSVSRIDARFGSLFRGIPIIQGCPQVWTEKENGRSGGWRDCWYGKVSLRSLFCERLSLAAVHFSRGQCLYARGYMIGKPAQVVRLPAGHTAKVKSDS